MITEIYRRQGGRTASRSRDNRQSSETWYVETNALMEADQILNEFVQPGGVFGGRLVDGLSAAESKDGYSWEVAINYAASATENPLAEPLRISGSQSATQVPVEFDRNGQPILNTAGDPFNEILFAEDFDDTLQLSYNVATVPFTASQRAKRSVSSGTVLGLPAGSVRYAGMSFQPQDHETLGIFYTITINLALAEDWRSRILNQGFRELDDEGELTPVMVGEMAASQPVLLDNDGKKLPKDGQPVTLEKDIYFEADYVALFGIPA